MACLRSATTMLRAGRALPLKCVPARVASLSTASHTGTGAHEPNTPMDLDPSLQMLLKDVDISIARHKARVESGVDSDLRMELEVYPGDEDGRLDLEILQDDYFH